ncbi:sigma-70 family RNA polymerase sigma factor [Microbacterium sp. MEC084]|uniref:RNA polymerase sigma factor n=1 Tax=unclassified Microbacterium TaxID=2609290 RepID=UPI0006FBEDA5|nr:MULTISPECIES: sigma-70 family RNA polymerase sigma factor [unclassified Microbacterium]KQY99175.1 RNA polymerase subunit sigma-24 [Microbacterium sp. Root53]MCD1269187.1 sigma-70 family RNA polymerase sigma factor [Microbacterium sp. MEC084]
MSDTMSDAELVARAADGMEHAFRLLYRRHARPVYWIAHGLLRSAADAEDVTQETFVVAWRKLRGLELAGDSLLPWLATICRFQAANRLRARRRAEADALDERQPDLDADVLQQVIDADLADRILREVEGLSPIDQRIFRLCIGEGYAYQAAADELGVAHGVVRNRLSRIRSRLRGVARETEEAR